MFGNLLNNVLITKAHNEKSIEIDPFDPQRLQIAQYSLQPKEIIYWTSSRRKQRHHLVDTDKPYRLQPHEYVMVVVRERVVLSDGIVGRFIPMSGLIEKGFGLTVGKLDPHYGRAGEEIRFGLINFLDIENEYSQDSPLAYIEFFDLRQLPSSPIELREYDRLIRLERRIFGENK